MPDFSMCHGAGCPVAQHCRRATATPTPLRQSWIEGTPYHEGVCDLYYGPAEFAPKSGATGSSAKRKTKS